mgnify:CR=1 FL=1
MAFAIQVAKKSDLLRVITMEYSITTGHARVLHGLRSRWSGCTQGAIAFLYGREGVVVFNRTAESKCLVGEHGQEGANTTWLAWLLNL